MTIPDGDGLPPGLSDELKRRLLAEMSDSSAKVAARMSGEAAEVRGEMYEIHLRLQSDELPEDEAFRLRMEFAEKGERYGRLIGIRNAMRDARGGFAQQDQALDDQQNDKNPDDDPDQRS